MAKRTLIIIGGETQADPEVSLEVGSGNITNTINWGFQILNLPRFQIVDLEFVWTRFLARGNF